MGAVFRKLRRALIPDRHWYPAAGRVRRVYAEGKVIGLWQRIQIERDLESRERLRCLRLPGFLYPFYYRAGTSDPRVILQVFAHREYECIANEADVSTIVDCGANIGCTAFYLLHRYPLARIVVVEPDPANMELCRRNLAPFRDRVTFVQAGVWSSATPMIVERGNYRDGAAWSFQTRPTQPGENSDFIALSMPELMQRGGFQRIDLLKVDIEAAEAEVFRTATWLDCVRTIAIELHGAECAQTVHIALLNYTYESGQSGELSVFREIRRVTT